MKILYSSVIVSDDLLVISCDLLLISDDLLFISRDLLIVSNDLASLRDSRCPPSPLSILRGGPYVTFQFAKGVVLRNLLQ